MKRHIGIALLLSVIYAAANPQEMHAQTSELSPAYWGVVLDSPAVKNVTVAKDVTYFKDDRATLGIDIYSPPGKRSGEKRPRAAWRRAPA